MRSFQLGEALKLDELGPIIVNPDGTTRRIANWDSLSRQERESAWRLISARNRLRIERLRGQEVGEESDSIARDTIEGKSE